jgi:hypothetical protein
VTPADEAIAVVDAALQDVLDPVERAFLASLRTWAMLNPGQIDAERLTRIRAGVHLSQERDERLRAALAAEVAR